MRFLRLRFCLAGVLAVSMAATPLIAGNSSADRGQVRPPASARSPQPVYRVEAGLQGEIYPVFANYASLQNQNERTFGVVAVTVSNPTHNKLHQRIMVAVQGWSDEEIQIIDVQPGASHTFLFAPSFLPRFYRNREITAATVKVSVSDALGPDLYETTVPVRLRSAEDMYWGNGFKYAPFIASWVTPHDPAVEDVLAEAKRYTPDHRLPGYENWKDQPEQQQETLLETKALFTALKQSGFSYVKSSLTLGSHMSVSERVRMPRASLRHTSGNCIDAVVAYASLFENLGMEPAVILVPGHAYVGVRVAEGAKQFLFLDAALTGRSTFENAVASAQTGLERNGPSAITQINIEDSRSAGIYPMP